MIGALALLAVLATFSVLASEMPRLAAWPLVILLVVHTSLQLRRYQGQPHRAFFFPGNDLAVLLDGQPIEAVAVQWRGPMAFLSWQDRDGRCRRLSWWPDTLPPARRRELRLAAGHRGASRHRLGMAP